MMDTCVLIPDAFSLVLTLHPNPKNILEMNVALWSNTTLPVGARFTPDDGAARLDKLEVYSYLPEDDVSEFIYYLFICLSIYLFIYLFEVSGWLPTETRVWRFLMIESYQSAILFSDNVYYTKKRIWKKKMFWIQDTTRKYMLFYVLYNVRGRLFETTDVVS